MHADDYYPYSLSDDLDSGVFFFFQFHNNNNNKKKRLAISCRSAGSTL